MSKRIENWFPACLIRAFDVGETQQKLYDTLHTKTRWGAKEEAEKIIVAEEDLKEYCNVNTEDAVELMENIIDGIEKEKSNGILDRLIINHDSEIVDVIKKAPWVKWQVE